ncbi:MAG: DMT family transporter [Planctomycetaceae bacterium]|nr:DMT family transporter [Planctomycetaceae bacterium]
MKLFALTALALIAFAANSFLCRWALGDELIDATSFTTVRIVSGAVALLLICLARPGKTSAEEGHADATTNSAGSPTNTVSPWLTGGLLFGYAICFSLAYVSLNTGLGALLLFGAVQVTMMTAALRTGERLTVASWIGFALAIFGVVYLLRPGAAAPPLLGAALMIGSGVSWGLYSIAGKASGDPILRTAVNFRIAVVPAVIASGIAYSSFQLQGRGALYAAISGALTSGGGYVLWYTVLPSLSRTQAAILQLLVPVIAAAAGIAFLGEALSSRLIISTVMIATGVAVTVLVKRPVVEKR